MLQGGTPGVAADDTKYGPAEASAPVKNPAGASLCVAQKYGIVSW